MKTKTLSQYIHTPLQTQKPDRRCGAYYVSVYDPDTGRVGRLLGPFNGHATALAMLPEVRERVIADRPEAHWFAFGTARWPTGTKTPGSYNHIL